MRGLSGPTIEAFDRRGLLNEIAAPRRAKGDSGGGIAATAAHWMQQARRPGGHFAGLQFHQDRIETSKWPYRLFGSAVTGMTTDLDQIESTLAARGTAMGVEIRRGFGVEDLDQSDDDVTIRAGGETFRRRWIFGCDDGRGVVRKAGGFTFVGADPAFTGYSLHVELADPDQLVPGRHDTPTGMST